MALRRKLVLLAMSLLLPATLLACSHVFVLGLMRVGDSDRAIVWAQGAPSAVEAVRTRITSNEVFRAGRVAIPGRPEYLSSACGPGAVELSFGGLGTHDAQAAREALETLATQAGLSVCASDTFLLNDASTDSAGGRAWFVAQHLLLYLLAPAASRPACTGCFANSSGCRRCCRHRPPGPASGWGLSPRSGWSRRLRPSTSPSGFRGKEAITPGWRQAATPPRFSWCWP